MKDIIIVDHKDSTIRRIRDIIIYSKIKVENIIECSSGFEAYNVIKNRHVDLLIICVNNKNKDGITLARNITKLKLKPKIIVISEVDNPSDIVKLLRCGVKEYLSSKFEDYELITSILRLEEEYKEEINEIIYLLYEQLKYLLLEDEFDVNLANNLDSILSKHITNMSYKVICTNYKMKQNINSNCLYFQNIKGHNVIIIKSDIAESFIDRNLKGFCLGISNMKPDDVRRKILGNKIAYIPQAAMNALNPTQKIIRFIEDVVRAHEPKAKKSDIYDLARKRFEILGLPESVLQKHSVELSGGMKQRTVIAISTILSPKVLIADEPSSALDVTSQKMVIKMLKDLMNNGFIKSMIFITHELPLLYNVTDDIMVMYAGQSVEFGKAKEMVFDSLHPYSKGLMGSIIVPEEGIKNTKLVAIPGTPPNLKKPPIGCRFAERCKYAKPECMVHSISERNMKNGRMYRCYMNESELREVYSNE